MFRELTKRRNIILGPKIVVRLSYDRLWIGPLSCKIHTVMSWSNVCHRGEVCWLAT